MTSPKTAPKRTGHQTTRVGSGLVALGSMSVLAIYATGFMKTKAASARMAESDAPRRLAAPVAVQAAAPVNSLPPLNEVPPPARPVAAPEDAGAPRAATPVTASPAPASTPVAPVEAGQPAAGGPTAIVAKTSAASSTPVTVAAPAPASTVAQPAAGDAAPAASPAGQPATASAAAQPAAAAAVAAAAPAAPGAVVYKDGTYTGWGTCRHGDIQAQVTIAAGRIASATISQCWTRYPCSWIAPLPPQVAQRQSAEVDYVSGATQSATAFYYAVIEALNKAK